MPYAPTDADQSDCGDLCIGVGAYGIRQCGCEAIGARRTGHLTGSGVCLALGNIEIERLRQAALQPAFEGTLR